MRRRRLTLGFTLVELLVAMVLLSMVMWGLSAALHSFGQSETRVDARILRSEKMRTTTVFLQELLGWVWGAKMPALDGGKGTSAVLGRSSEVVWLGTMPARFGVGGLHYLRLWLRPDDRGGTLVLSYQPVLDKKLAFPDWSAAQSIDLCEGVDGLELAYLEQDGTEWLSQWQSPDKLPKVVRLRLHSPEGNWPLQAIQVTSGGRDANGGSGAAVVGGGAHDDDDE